MLTCVNPDVTFRLKAPGNITVSSVAIALKWLFVTIRNFGGIPPPEEKYANRQQISRAAGGVEIQSKSCVTVN